MKIKHIVVSRVAINWRVSETNLGWEEWVKNSFELYDKYCRSSLKKQTNQDFTLLSLVDSKLNNFGNQLNNETIIPVNYNGDIRKTIIDGINSYIKTITNKYDYVILTRLDRDDALNLNFIENVQKLLINANISERYIDIKKLYSYDAINNKIYESKKYDKTVSPFVSVIEKISDDKIKCLPYRVDHNMIPHYLKGKKNNELIAMQIIHDNNLKNKLTGNKEIFNISKIKKEFYL